MAVVSPDTGSVYQQVLGSRYGRLQAQLQEYFSLAAGSGSYGSGTGVFDVVGCPLPWLRPALAPAAAENSFFPDFGHGIEFRIENYAHQDPFGRSTLTALRRIDFPGRRRTFEDSTTLDPRHGLLDYVGRHRAVVTGLRLDVTSGGHLRISSSATRVLAGPFRLALPGFVDARAYTEQGWNPETGKFDIQTRVIQRQLGTIFAYAGSFNYTVVDAEQALPERDLPHRARPARWEGRA